MKSNPFFAPWLLSALLCSTGASAATPGNVQNLVGSRASGGESDLRSRGYVHIQTQKGVDRSYSMWWNPKTEVCITVATMDGRYNSITTSPAMDCNQEHVSSSNSSDDNAAAAALIIGAAAVIGAVALEHKSHHHENKSHSGNHSYEAQFERGHLDGLYNHSFDNRENSQAYLDGYYSGVEQRNHDTSYRYHSGRHGGGYGAAQTTEFSELNGRSVSNAHDKLKNWGFRKVDTLERGSTEYTLWYRRSSGQCLQATEANGRTVDVRDIRRSPACR